MFHDKNEEDLKALDTFLAKLQPGETATGGQELLRKAFTNYYRARYTGDQKLKHEAAYFANCLAVLHEHIRLEPYIKKSIKDNPSLKYDPSQLQTVEFEKFIGPEGSALRAKTWEQVLAA